jgi:ornithine cyclodeaminase
MLRIIDSATVRSLYTIADAVPAMADALVRFSAGKAYQHPRVTVQPPDTDGMVLLMPAATDTTLALKVLSMFPRSVSRGLPSVQGLIVLVDAVYGEPVALIDGTAVTEIRTAAVTALATDRLAPPAAGTLALIGAGAQARGHLLALADTRPWTAVRIHSRTAERATALAEWARARGIAAEVVDSAAEAVWDAKVICTVTSACSPVLAAADVAESGVHINAVGAFGAHCRELPSELVARSRLFVDSREATLREAGDVMIPMAEGAVGPDVIVGEIGGVLAGDKGRLGDELTIFKSLGLPIEDLMTAQMIYQRAVEEDAGLRVTFP